MQQLRKTKPRRVRDAQRPAKPTMPASIPEVIRLAHGFELRPIQVRSVEPCPPGEKSGRVVFANAEFFDALPRTISRDEQYKLICEAVGAASMCWHNVAGAGVFDSEKAIKVAEKLLRDLRGEAHPPEPTK